MCDGYKEYRYEFFNKLCFIDSFKNMSNEEKYKFLMTSDDYEIVNELIHFINKLFEQRRELFEKGKH